MRNGEQQTRCKVFRVSPYPAHKSTPGIEMLSMLKVELRHLLP